jgi:hypothetical protein
VKCLLRYSAGTLLVRDCSKNECFFFYSIYQACFLSRSRDTEANLDGRFALQSDTNNGETWASSCGVTVTANLNIFSSGLDAIWTLWDVKKMRKGYGNTLQRYQIVHWQYWICEVFFSPLMPPHVPYWLRGLPFRLRPKCNRLLSLGRPWSPVTLSRLGGWWYMNIEYQEGALSLSSDKLPRPWSLWESSPSRKITMVEPGIEPGTLWSLVRNFDHSTTRLGSASFVILYLFISLRHAKQLFMTKGWRLFTK